MNNKKIRPTYICKRCLHEEKHEFCKQEKKRAKIKGERIIALSFDGNKPEREKIAKMALKKGLINEEEYKKTLDSFRKSLAGKRIKKTPAEKTHNNIINYRTAKAIREKALKGKTQAELAKKYNVSQSTVSNIINDKVWKRK